MKCFHKHLFGLFLAIPLIVSGNEADRLFYEAVRVEAQGELDAAIALYEGAKTFAHSANLYGNLGNLYFKTNHYGKAILNYKKAILLVPENLEFKANLRQVMEVANLPIATPTADDSYFAPNTINLWCWLTVALFWSGLIGGFFLWGAILPIWGKAGMLATWAALVGLGMYACWRSDNNAALLFREAVAIAESPADAMEEPGVIPLRRYAGETNEANAELKSGEIVRIEVEDGGKLKTHVSSDGVVWYLARSRSGGKKGWAKKIELRRILN
jgi:tetratricopeptide (TPR) repeat protein